MRITNKELLNMIGEIEYLYIYEDSRLGARLNIILSDGTQTYVTLSSKLPDGRISDQRISRKEIAEAFGGS